MARLPKRPSRSLRAEHLASTRRRILDGLLEAMAKGIAELSIPSVARHSGVSVPTVYRHFGSKRGLLEALGEHVEKRARLSDLPRPSSLDELCGSVPLLFERLDGMSDSLQAAMASELGKRVRSQGLIPERLRFLEGALTRSARGLKARDRRRLVNVVVILWSSSALRACKTYLGLSHAEAANNVSWAIRALVRGARTKEAT